MLSTLYRQSASTLSWQVNICRATATSLVNPNTQGVQQARSYHGQNKSNGKAGWFNTKIAAGATATAAAAVFAAWMNDQIDGSVLGSAMSVHAKDESKSFKSRGPGERKFNEFATREFNGEMFMTPQDFLDSLVMDKPKQNKKTKLLKRSILDRMMKVTPSIGNYVEVHTGENPKFLRDIGEDGIISFAEYIFLLSLLNKPQSMLRVAFDIIDKSRENSIMLTEFLQFCKMASSAHTESRILIAASVETTLKKHFFGHAGNGKLTYSEFNAFVNGLQREVLQTEFDKYAKGSKHISESDFAKMLFKYTDLTVEERKQIFDEMEQRLPGTEDQRPGLKLEEVEMFFNLINNISEFAFAYKLHPYSDTSQSQESFERSATVTLGGLQLSKPVVDVVFALFSQEDKVFNFDLFYKVVHNRLGRQVKMSLKKKTGLKAFGSCMRNEVDVIRNQL